MKIKRIIYCFEDGSYKQIESEELDNFAANLEEANMCALMHGHAFKPINWQTIELNYDKKLDTQVWN